MIRIISRVAPDVALAWSLAAIVLFGGFVISSHWFEASRATLAATAETAALEIAANEKVLRTKPKLVHEHRTIDEILSHVDLSGDTPSTVAHFLRELDRTARSRGVRLVSIASGVAGRDAATSARVAPAPNATMGPGANAASSLVPAPPADPFDAVPLDVVVEGRFVDVIGLVRSLAADRTLVTIEVRSIIRASGQQTAVPRLTSTLGITLYHRAREAVTPTVGGNTHGST